MLQCYIQHKIIQISRKSIMLCHERIIFFFFLRGGAVVVSALHIEIKSQSLERHGLQWRKILLRNRAKTWFTSFALGQGINLWKREWHRLIFPISQWEHSSGIYTPFVMVRVIILLPLSIACFISTIMYKLNVGECKYFCIETLFLLAKQALFWT